MRLPLMRQKSVALDSSLKLFTSVFKGNQLFYSSILTLATILFVGSLAGLAINILTPFHTLILFSTIFFIVLFFIKSELMVYSCLAIVFFFPNIGWGVVEPKNIFNIYGKGTGVLGGISLVNIFLWLSCLSVILQKLSSRGDRNNQVSHNLSLPFLLFSLLYSAQIIRSVANGYTFLEAISVNGVLNLLNMFLFFWIIINTFSAKEQINRLIDFFLISVLLRGIYGIIRFLFFGGDPANYYTNFGGSINVKITFWDVGDALLFSTAFFLSVLSLVRNTSLSQIRKYTYLAISVVSVLNILFSYRRNAWIGFLLVLLWLYFLLPKLRFKSLFLFLFFILILPIALILIPNRFGTGIEGFLSDIIVNGQLSYVHRSRFAELYLALQTVKENWLFGVGTAGTYKVFYSYLWNIPSPEFVHSSIIHVLLKTGIIGLILYLSIFALYIKVWISARKKILEDNISTLLGGAGFAGFIFLIPSILFTTMMIQYRHMALLGLCLALPYIAYHTGRVQSQNPSQK